MTTVPSPKATAAADRSPLQPADLPGLAQLIVDGTLGIVDLVERMHHTIARGTGIVAAAPPGPTTGITGLVYRAVRGGTRLSGRALEALLGVALHDASARPGSPPREALLAVLNGIWGDHLEASANPLAIATRLRHGGQPLTLERDALAARFPSAGPGLVVLAHGLCMNDLQWQRDGHDHGQALARDLGLTPLYLHYNTGRHVSANGRDFAALLQRLVAQWPQPVTRLVIVGHSMGGLVTRSACQVAQEQDMAWLQALRGLVFLGTPHHGAPLERGGLRLDRLLGISPYAAPFARLGRARSAGITDLRFGNLRDADWQGRDRHAQRHDDRQPTPLPSQVPAFVVAATTADHPDRLRSRLLGDGLVRLDSALGRHRRAAMSLDIPPSRQRVVTGANHWDLLSRPEVYEAIRDWLRQGPPRLPDQAGSPL